MDAGSFCCQCDSNTVLSTGNTHRGWEHTPGGKITERVVYFNNHFFSVSSCYFILILPWICNVSLYEAHVEKLIWRHFSLPNKKRKYMSTFKPVIHVFAGWYAKNPYLQRQAYCRPISKSSYGTFLGVGKMARFSKVFQQWVMPLISTKRFSLKQIITWDWQWSRGRSSSFCLYDTLLCQHLFQFYKCQLFGNVCWYHITLSYNQSAKVNTSPTQQLFQAFSM